ncbi:hypothetical protein ES705_13182 [subsurface metagenome]|nr:hypothetical protein [Clostridia bacterium]
MNIRLPIKQKSGGRSKEAVELYIYTHYNRLQKICRKFKGDWILRWGLGVGVMP